MEEIKNISALVVQTRPEFLNDVLKSLQELNICDIHFYDEHGRIVVTIEGKNADEEISKIKKIQSIPHVISAELHFTYTADELNEAIKEIERKQEEILNFLNDDSVPAEKIRYSGNLRRDI